MIVLKRRSIRIGKASLISNLGKKSDHVFYSIRDDVKRFISYFNRRTFILIGQWIAFHVLFHTRKVYVEVKHKALSNPHGKKVIDAVRGKGEVKDHGASLYLRRISSK